MNTKLTRRAALALPFAVPAIGALDVLGSSSASEPESEPATASDPESAIIPGLNQIATLTMMCIVRTPDGRAACVQITSTGDDVGTTARHFTDSGDHLTAQIPADLYATLPGWLLRELGFAALAATKGGAS